MKHYLLTLCLALLFLPNVYSQTRSVTGKVTDQNGNPIPGVTVTVKGSNTSAQTSSDGTYRIEAGDNSILVFTSVGFSSMELSVKNKATADLSLTASNASLNEVVVIGYGTARKRDLTGAVATVSSKDFNKGVVASPDQLIQGLVAGLEVTNNTGQPGGATTVKIRGNNSIRSGNDPLYVVDGVPLDGRTADPPLYLSGLGTTPTSNPLLFINPADIAAIDVLKDASAAAIYGSRGANGVIMITTKKGQANQTRIEAGASSGFSDLMRKADVLDVNQYRAELKKYGAASDSGASLNPFQALIRTAITQNYTAALSGGTETGRFRASFLLSDQQGIVRKTDLKKYVTNINGQYKFLDKRLSIDFYLTAAHVTQQVAPISTDAGSNGNIISAALDWNPTLPLIENGLYNQHNPSGVFNPLALSDAYDEYINTTTLLGNISAAYKITKNLEFKTLYGVNYGQGLLQNQIQGWFNGSLNDVQNPGLAYVGNTQLFSNTFTNTLNYNKELSSKVSLNATLGTEYWTTDYSGSSLFGKGFDFNVSQSKTSAINYYDDLQDANSSNLAIGSFHNPSTELQSYFGRAILNLQDKYIFTGTLRADGSSKFGVSNKYAYFPSIAGAWNITNEDFMRDNNIFNNLKLRIGWGETGNQEFPSGSSQFLGQYQGYGGNFQTLHFADSILKWETVKSTDIGLDFTILHNRVYGFVDYFNKRTIDPLFLGTLSQPSSGATIWSNLKGGYISNKGLEIMIGAEVVRTNSFSWNLRVNGEFVKNKFIYPALANSTSPLYLTGAINGQGVSNTYSEAIANNQPVDAFYLRTFSGFDKNGQAITTNTSSYVGDPNPHVIAGLSTDVNYKKLSLIVNMHGSFGGEIFNNTLLTVTNLSNIANGKNISQTLLNTSESLTNPVSASTRFLQSGNYVKLGNATLRYNFGNIGNYIKNASIYFTGSNLFEITKYTGFDAEVNTANTNGGVPSLGVDYIGYPTARTFIFGINFSL